MHFDSACTVDLVAHYNVRLNSSTGVVELPSPVCPVTIWSEMTSRVLEIINYTRHSYLI